MVNDLDFVRGITVGCRDNAVNFLQILQNTPIARPLGQVMGCGLWVQTVIDTQPQSPE